MKSLLILLALVAAANASCYYTKCFPGCYYSGCYSTYQCLALPCFSGKATCPRPKCVVYTDIVYPPATCTFDMAETDVAILEQAYKDKLAGEKTTLVQALDAAKKTFDDDVDARTTTYITDQSKIITDFYDAKIAADADNKDCYESAKQAAITKITNRANANAKSAKDCYKTSYDNAIKAIDNAHTCWVSNYKSCLENRLTKIAAYNTKVEGQMTCLKTNFKKRLDDRRDCMTDSFEKTLKKCFDTDVSAVVAIYKAKIDAEIAIIVGKYNTLIDGNEKKLKEAYKCGLTCDGCRCNYNRKCLSLTWCVDSRLTRPCARTKKYSYCCRLPNYQTCTCEDKVEKTAAKLEEDLDKIIKAAVDKAKADKLLWESAQETRNTNASDAFGLQIDACHKDELARMTQCGATADEITARKAEHVAEKATLMTEFNDKQKTNYDAAKTAYATAITNYETNLNKCKKSIVDAYSACLTKKAQCITDYETKLKARVAEKRTSLVDNLKTTTDKNVKCYEDLIVAFVGEDKRADADVVALVKQYRDKLEADDKVKEKAFDDHWNPLIPKMVTSYGCKLTCKCRTFTPRPFCYNPCMRQPRVCIPKKTYVKKYCYSPCYYYGNYCGC